MTAVPSSLCSFQRAQGITIYPSLVEWLKLRSPPWPGWSRMHKRKPFSFPGLDHTMNVTVLNVPRYKYRKKASLILLRFIPFSQLYLFNSALHTLMLGLTTNKLQGLVIHHECIWDTKFQAWSLTWLVHQSIINFFESIR